MTVKINIETDNAAFHETGEGAEVARILRKLANQLEGEYNLCQDDGSPLFDFNGNKVGTVRIEP